ncbi:MAG: Rne/Rng family ribonuclease [Propionibacteriaceae bacterium]|nr:Rne/Rng family ribonuclease [Propionibacteriaceae bacterium]
MLDNNMADSTNENSASRPSDVMGPPDNQPAEAVGEYRPKKTRRPRKPLNTEDPAPSAAADPLGEDSGAHHGFAPKGKTRKSTKRKTDDTQLAETPETEAPKTPARKNTRKKTTTDAAAGESTTPTATESNDPIGEALEELSRTQRTRKTTTRARKKAHDSRDDLDTAQALDDLAQAIAAAPSPENDDSTGSQDGNEDFDTSGTNRRRRRRGGRKRRGPGADDDPASEATDDNPESGSPDQKVPSSESTPPSEESSKHRRRRRRRQGEDVDDVEDSDADVVVKVRQPRTRKKQATKDTTDTKVEGIEGSTRLEAKKQRRREGRAASRRRTPILSEAEFLARRESVERTMLIRQKQDYSQIAVIEDGILVEHYVDRASATSLIGNIYLGKVQNVLPGMEAAFIDIGRGRNAVLYAGEVDWDSFGEAGQERKIEDVFSAGQLAVVQVSKDPVGAKGARLTSHVSIPGRYVVYAPKGHIAGISRKLSEKERNRLKNILDSLVDETATVVIRTAAEGTSEDELVRDVNRLKAQWEVIEKKTQGKQTPQLLYTEPDLTMRIVRDLFTEDFSTLIVDGNGGMEDAFDTVSAYVSHVSPHLRERIQKWDREKDGDVFAKYRIDEQIAKALDRKVHLPSGGSLVIDRTEAMTVIDVNTGKFTGAGGNLEATVTSNNLEAAEEIVRQLRLRDIGGIIIIDFIDMVLPSNRELLLRRLVECLGRDRTRHQVSEVTSLGLVQMTRKKVGTGLAEAFTTACEACEAMGRIRFDEPVENQAPSDGGERSPGRRSRRRSS